MSAAGAATFNSSITATSLDISGDIDIDGTANLDTVDIDGPVNAAAAVTINGVLTANAGAIFNEGSADVDFRVESDRTQTLYLCRVLWFCRVRHLKSTSAHVAQKIETTVSTGNATLSLLAHSVGDSALYPQPQGPLTYGVNAGN